MSDAELEDEDPVAKAAREEEEREHRRMKALNELFSTEETYNHLLGLLIVNYVVPLRDFTILTEEQHQCLFPQVEILKGLSDKFLGDLRIKMEHWHSEESVLSDMFKSFAHFFKMYQTYVNNYDRAVALMGKIENKKTWVEYMAKVRADCDGFNLASLLILPVQRIPRYNLLLGEVLKNTLPTHIDYDGLTQARQDVLGVSSHINEQMKQSEKNEAVRKIERLFTQNIQLLEAARVFIRRGKLWKVCRSKDRVYEFFLFNDLLLYASTYGTKLNLHNSLEIDTAFSISWIEDAKYGEIQGRAFQIVSSKKSFVVYAQTPQEAEDWFKDISRVSQKAKETAELRGHGTKESVAVWVPDAHAETCTMDGCDRKFTFVNRRHHCRKCGSLVCSQCSKYKLPNAEGVMQRACKRCYYGDMGADAPTESVMDGSAGAMDDDSSEDEFQAEAEVLQNISFYIESEGELTLDEIFARFGRGDGSYCLMPTLQMADSDQYLVELHVYSSGRIVTFSVGLVTKKRGIEFRLNKESSGGGLLKKSKFKDFVSMKQLIEHITKKEKIVFSYAIPRIEVYNSLVKSAWTSGGVSDLFGGDAAAAAMLDSMGSGGNPFEAYAKRGNTLAVDLDLYPKAKALYDYEADVVGDLNMRAGEIVYVISKDQLDGWWTGVIPGAHGDFAGERSGLFPSTYVELLDPSHEIPKGKNEPKQGDVLIARYSYADASKEELSFEAGDRIELMDKDPTGWWLGKLHKTGAVGWFAPDLVAPRTEAAVAGAAAGEDSKVAEDGTGVAIAATAATTTSTAVSSEPTVSSSAPPAKKEATTKKGKPPSKSAKKPPPKKKSSVPTASESSGGGSSSSSAAPSSTGAPPSSAAAKAGSESSSAKSTGSSASVSGDLVIPYDDLVSRNFDKNTVNIKQLEDYLSEDDFKKVFGMSRADFTEIPKWKQARLKRDHKLF